MCAATVLSVGALILAELTRHQPRRRIQLSLRASFCANSELSLCDPPERSCDQFTTPSKPDPSEYPSNRRDSNQLPLARSTVLDTSPSSPPPVVRPRITMTPTVPAPGQARRNGKTVPANIIGAGVHTR